MKRSNLAFVSMAVALAAGGGVLDAVPVAERREPSDAASRTTPYEQRTRGGVPAPPSQVAWGKFGGSPKRRPKAERKQRRAARRQRGKR
jgi:hypothetical protein